MQHQNEAAAITRTSRECLRCCHAEQGQRQSTSDSSRRASAPGDGAATSSGHGLQEPGPRRASQPGEPAAAQGKEGGNGPRSRTDGELEVRTAATCCALSRRRGSRSLCKPSAGVAHKPSFGSLVMRWASLVHGLVRIYIAETEEWPRSHTGDKVDIGGVWDACLSI